MDTDKIAEIIRAHSFNPIWTPQIIKQLHAKDVRWYADAPALIDALADHFAAELVCQNIRCVKGRVYAGHGQYRKCLLCLGKDPFDPDNFKRIATGGTSA